MASFMINCGNCSFVALNCVIYRERSKGKVRRVEQSCFSHNFMARLEAIINLRTYILSQLFVRGLVFVRQKSPPVAENLGDRAEGGARLVMEFE